MADLDRIIDGIADAERIRDAIVDVCVEYAVDIMVLNGRITFVDSSDGTVVCDTVRVVGKKSAPNVFSRLTRVDIGGSDE